MGRDRLPVGEDGLPKRFRTPPAAVAAGGDHPAVVFGALPLLGPVFLWKAVRDARDRREAKARAATEAGC